MSPFGPNTTIEGSDEGPVVVGTEDQRDIKLKIHLRSRLRSCRRVVGKERWKVITLVGVGPESVSGKVTGHLGLGRRRERY